MTTMRVRSLQIKRPQQNRITSNILVYIVNDVLNKNRGMFQFKIEKKLNGNNVRSEGLC